MTFCFRASFIEFVRQINHVRDAHAVWVLLDDALSDLRIRVVFFGGVNYPLAVAASRFYLDAAARRQLSGPRPIAVLLAYLINHRFVTSTG